MSGSVHSFPRQQPNSQMMGDKAVGFFWDIENCPVPRGKAAFGVISRVRKFILNRRDHREFEFMIACDVTKLIIPIQEDVSRAGGVTLSHVLSTSKNAADEKLREAMKKFVDTHGASSCLILISGDIDFVNDLRGYQNRLGVNIIVLHGRSASAHFKQGGWDEVHDFEDFCIPVEPIPTKGGGGAPVGQGNGGKGPKPPPQGGPLQFTKNKAQGPGQGQQVQFPKKQNPGPPQGAPRNQPGGKAPPFKAPEGFVLVPKPQAFPPKAPKPQQQTSSSSTEIILMVCGLPGSMDHSILRPALQDYADDVRGRVKFVNNGQGFITFRTQEDALAALSMFDGIEVYGKKLKISQVKSIPFPTPKPTTEKQHGPSPSSGPPQQRGVNNTTANNNAGGGAAVGLRAMADFVDQARAALEQQQGSKKANKSSGKKRDEKCSIQ